MRKVSGLLVLSVLFLFASPIFTFGGEVFFDALKKAEGEKAKTSPKLTAMRAIPRDLFAEGSCIYIRAHTGKFLSVKPDSNIGASQSKPSNLERLRVFSIGGNRVAFLSVHGKFVSQRQELGGNPVLANASLIGPWEGFEPIKNPDGSFSFKAANGQFMCVELNETLVANRGVIDSWEKFRVEAAPNPSFSQGAIVGLFHEPSKKYFAVQIDSNQELLAEANEPGMNERFRVVQTLDSRIGLQTDNGTYVCADLGNPKFALRAGVPHLQAWESFDIIHGLGETVFIRAANGKFLSVEDGEVRAISEAPVPLIMKTLPAEIPLPFTPIRSKDGLRCGYVKDFSPAEWDSKDLGTKFDISIFRPKVPKGWAFVGDAVSMGKEPPQYSVLVIKDDPGSEDLKKPVDYEQIWSDRVNHKDSIKKNCQHVSLWRPIPPAGYVAMGMVVTRDYKNPMQVPSLANLRCVKANLVELGRASQPIWNDKGSDAVPPVSLFSIRRDDRDTSGLPPGTFLAGHYNDFPVGGAGGKAVSELAPNNDWYLVGFEGRCGAYIDEIKPVYRSISDPASTTYGTNRGGKGGGPFSVIAKPGYAVGKVIGRCGAYIDAFQIEFYKIDGYHSNPEDKYVSPWVGGPGGSPFSLGGGGSLFHGVNMSTGSLVDTMGLIPMPIIEPWVIRGMTPDDFYQDALEGMKDALLLKKQGEINQAAKDEFLKKNPKLAELASQPTSP